MHISVKNDKCFALQRKPVGKQQIKSFDSTQLEGEGSEETRKIP